MPQTREFIIMLQPPRSDFNETSTEEEDKIITKHFDYLKRLLAKGALKLAGRCDDATFGLVIIETESLEKANQIMANDPAVQAGIFTAQIWPYRTALER